MRLSVEQEAGVLERQEEKFQEAFDGSEEDVFGHGVTWDEEENVEKEDQERIQPPTTLQTLERMTKRLGQKMMEKWDGHFAQHLVRKQDPPPLRCKRIHGEWNDRQERELGRRCGNLVSPRFDTMWDVVMRKIRRTDAVPLAILRSQSFSADKGMRIAACVWRGTAAFTAERRKMTGRTGLMEGFHVEAVSVL